MFNRARWWGEKNKVKVVFELHFHAFQVAGDGLMVSIVPADAGKPTAKLDKAPIRDGSCFWENPVYLTVKFNQDPKSGKIHERMYYFIIGTGSSKAGVVGEASIDFSDYYEATKVSLVSLPLKNSKTEALLHVSIQRIPESTEQRDVDESENAELFSKDHNFRTQSGNHGTIIRTNSVEYTPFDNNVNRQASTGSDVTISSSDNSSGVESLWEPQVKKNNAHHEPAGYLSSLTVQKPKSDAPAPLFEERRRSWDWLGNSALEAGTDDCSSTPRETFPRQHSEEDIVIEKLKSELAALSRQAEMSELELQTLRKQIVRETKRGQHLWGEIVCLKEERDALKGECEQFKASLRCTNEAETKTNVLLDSADSQAMAEELRQELDNAKEMNANLRIQLQNTQESNSELILAVRDLDEMLEWKNKEILNQSFGSLRKVVHECSREVGAACHSDEDDEQKALEELVKEHSDAKEAYLLEQRVMDLHGEIEIYERDKDELEMQMEQLALDYEIMKQENHDLKFRLEQSQIQEKLEMRYECLSSGRASHELETQMENLENELRRRSKEYVDSLVTINELESRAKSLEEELEKQAQGFEADLETLTRSKVEQEQRAIRAEETLKKLKWKNADTAERLQEEFRRLSLQMTSTFEANEKLATKALAEANGLRLQKGHLEEMLRKTYEERQSVEGQYEAGLCQVTSQVTLMKSQIEKMQAEIEDRVLQLDHQKKHAEETQRVLSDKILMLEEEIEMHKAKIEILSEENVRKKTLIHELEQMRTSIKEMELLVEQGYSERIELKNRVVSMKTEAEKTHEELNKMRCHVKEKEVMVGNLESELDVLQSQCMELKHSLLARVLEREKLRKQVTQLTSDIQKRDDEFKSMQTKIKDYDGRGSLDIVKKSCKPLPRGSIEIESLKERVKLLEGQIKLKETALETSANKFLEKETDLHNKIAELEGKLKALNQSSAHLCLNEVEKIAAVVEDLDASLRPSEEARNININLTKMCQAPNRNDSAALSTKSNDLPEAPKVSLNSSEDFDELKNEMALLKQRNILLEGELKEMQERYSETSLKFAEVEGERQQLVMILRSLKNSNKSP